MLGRESGSNTRTREEILYWRSLNPFFKVDLHGNFHSGLEVPLYFCDNVKGKLPHNVVLKGPGVEIDAWEVQLKTTDDITRFVGEGWKDFVAAFCLEENDSLVFKYKNNSYFKVRIFNGKTSCEKESSHFVMKSVSKIKEESCSQIQETNIIKQETGSEVLKIKNNDYVGCLSRGSMNDEPLVFSRNVKTKTEPEADHMSSTRSREHTAKQIERARQQAKEIQRFTEKSFYVALSRSHVSGTMKLGIHKHWWNEFIKVKCNKCLKLRLKGKTEYDPQLYFCVYDESNSTATITTGWKKFVQENSLYEFDCCVFSLSKPLEENHEFIHMDVQIVRAIMS